MTFAGALFGFSFLIIALAVKYLADKKIEQLESDLASAREACDEYQEELRVVGDWNAADIAAVKFQAALEMRKQVKAGAADRERLEAEVAEKTLQAGLSEMANEKLLAIINSGNTALEGESWDENS